LIDYQHLSLTYDQPVESTVTVTMNRPEVHNAFNAQTMKEIIRCIQDLGKDPSVRVIVLTGKGRSFCACADLNWMRETINYNEEDNLADVNQIAQMYETVNICPKPVIARINGAAIGGGSGLVSASDIAIAVERARFGFGEVNLGIIPAVIAPFVLQKIGMAAAREFFLTGARIDAQRAKEIGLIHYVVTTEEELDQKVRESIDQLLSSGPQAIAECKQLLHLIKFMDPHKIQSYTVQKTAEVRTTPEAHEGFTAFLEKRKPVWNK